MHLLRENINQGNAFCQRCGRPIDKGYYRDNRSKVGLFSVASGIVSATLGGITARMLFSSTSTGEISNLFEASSKSIMIILLFLLAVIFLITCFISAIIAMFKKQKALGFLGLIMTIIGCYIVLLCII